MEGKKLKGKGEAMEVLAPCLETMRKIGKQAREGRGREIGPFQILRRGRKGR